MNTVARLWRITRLHASLVSVLASELVALPMLPKCSLAHDPQPEGGDTLAQILARTGPIAVALEGGQQDRAAALLADWRGRLLLREALGPGWRWPGGGQEVA